MTMRSMSGRVVALGLLAGALATPAFAQDGLVVNGRWMGAVGQFGLDLGLAPPEGIGQSIGGGRYALVGSRIVDRRTGASRDLPPFLSIAAVDPVRPRIFLRSPGALFAAITEMDAVSGALRSVMLIGARHAGFPGDVQYAYSAGWLFVDLADTLFAPPNLPLTHDIRAFDGATGAPLPARFTFTGLPGARWLVTPEGDTAFIAEPGGLTHVDLATGTRRTAALPATGFQWDEVNERLIADVGESVGVLTRDGTLLGTAGMGNCHAIALSPHTGRLYVRRGLQSTAFSLEDVRVFDSRTYQLLGQVFLPYRVDCTVSVLAAPGPPRALTANVRGRDVSLSWVNVGAASHFVLDVGLAPGRTDLSIYLGPDSHASFAGVPAGTYYLRLRGGNAFGGGRPSQEVRAVVP